MGRMDVRVLHDQGLTTAAISRGCGISRTEVRRLLGIGRVWSEAEDIIAHFRHVRSKRYPSSWIDKYAMLILEYGLEEVLSVVEYAKRVRFHETRTGKIRDRYTPSWVLRNYKELHGAIYQNVMMVA